MKRLLAGVLLATLTGCASLASMPLPRPAPEGASAFCNDHTFSFARSIWDTCSQHEGVDSWLNASSE